DAAQSGVGLRRGVVEHAVQQGERRAAVAYPAHGPADLLAVAGARGQQYRLAVGGDLVDQRLVRQVARRDLVHVHELVDELRGAGVERRAHERDATLVAALREGPLRGLAEGVVLLEERGLRRRGLLAEVPVGGGVLHRQVLGLVGLELDRVGPGVGRVVDVAEGGLERALVVHARLGDDERAEGQGAAVEARGEQVHDAALHADLTTSSMILSTLARPCDMSMADILSNRARRLPVSLTSESSVSLMVAPET